MWEENIIRPVKKGNAEDHGLERRQVRRGRGCHWCTRRQASSQSRQQWLEGGICQLRRDTSRGSDRHWCRRHWRSSRSRQQWWEAAAWCQRAFPGPTPGSTGSHPGLQGPPAGGQRERLCCQSPLGTPKLHQCTATHLSNGCQSHFKQQSCSNAQQ